MQTMRMDEKGNYTKNGVLQIQRLRSLGRFPSMRRVRRIWSLLNHKPQGTKGGTVEPPCDFQVLPSQLPDCQTIDPQRAGGMRAPPHAHTRKAPNKAPCGREISYPYTLIKTKQLCPHKQQK